MPYVVTVARHGGSRDAAGIADVLGALAGLPAAPGFEHPAGVEQAPGPEQPAGASAVLAEPADVVDVVLGLVRLGGWSIGVGAGPAVPPPPESGRTGSGPAFLAARRAVDAATRRAPRLAVRGAVPADAGDAQAVLTALGAVIQRRSAPAWEAIALVDAGRSQAEAAVALGISRQAVGQRLAAGLWGLERELRPTAARLLARAAG